MRFRFIVPLWAAVAFADVTAIRELIRAGKFLQAAAACEADLKRSPASAPVLTLQGLALRGAGNTQAALQSFRAALRAAPVYMPALQGAAQLEFESRDVRAETTLAAITRADPSSATAHAMLAELAFEKSDWQRFLTHAARTPPSPLLQWRRGVALFGLDRFREAAAEFQALLAFKDHPPTRFNLALALWRAGDAGGTLEALSRLDDPDSVSLRASALRARKDVPAALEVLQAAVRAHPSDERLLVELALLCLDQNALELGTAVLEAGVANNPASSRLLTALGVFRARSGQMEKAEANFAAARQLAPNDGLGAVGTATALLQLGLPGDAEKVLRKLPANSPIVALTLARALLQKNESREAKKLLHAVILREPRNADALALLGRTLAAEGASQTALRHLEAAIRLNPNDKGTVYPLIALYKKFGRNADAARMGSRLRELMAKEKADGLEAQRYQLSLAAAN